MATIESLYIVISHKQLSKFEDKLTMSGAVVGAPKAKSKLVTLLPGFFCSSRKDGCVGWDQASNSKNIVVACDSGDEFLAPDG